METSSCVRSRCPHYRMRFSVRCNCLLGAGTWSVQIILGRSIDIERQPTTVLQKFVSFGSDVERVYTGELVCDCVREGGLELLPGGRSRNRSNSAGDQHLGGMDPA